MEPEILARVEAVITSSEILVEVDIDKNGNYLDDDGCSDGRGWKRIFQGTIQKFKSLNRSKVFGGGTTMATSTVIGLGQATGQVLTNVFRRGIQKLQRKSIDFGAHTADHAHGPDCGCGAIDKAVGALTNIVKYQKEIAGSITGLGIDDTDLSVVLENFIKYSTSVDNSDYTGKQVADQITTSGKVSKELTGPHLEGYIILNMVRGYTVNQEKIREVSDGKVQVFALDVWRLQDIASRLYGDEPLSVQHQAFLSELVYTLGVAATLTKGDLPVYTVASQNQLEPAAT